MKVILARNVQDALPQALELLKGSGQRRDSRNGPVIQGPPVTTVYKAPWERVIFWPQRDANPFFHLYESLWMLAGRDDVAPLVRYAKNMADYSDDGQIFHGAYGRRWRKHFSNFEPTRSGSYIDQLPMIAKALKENPEDRRCVLQMWDAEDDLGRNGKDLPCNLIATFQRGIKGELNLVVFCRSNDIIWGAYGANAVQFSTLLEYMALWIGCAMGTYTQISVNWHAYVDKLEQIKGIHPDRAGYLDNPYSDYRVHHVPMIGPIENLDRTIGRLLRIVDTDKFEIMELAPKDPWANTVHFVLKAHHVYKTFESSDINRFDAELEVLVKADPQADWVVAAREWFLRRQKTAMTTTGAL